MPIVEIVAWAVGVALYVAARNFEIGSTAFAFVEGSGALDCTQLVLRFLLIAVAVRVLSSDARLVIRTSFATL